MFALKRKITHMRTHKREKTNELAKLMDAWTVNIQMFWECWMMFATGIWWAPSIEEMRWTSRAAKREREYFFGILVEFQLEINANCHCNEESRCVSRALFTLANVCAAAAATATTSAATTITSYTFPLPLILMLLLLNRKMCWKSQRILW